MNQTDMIERITEAARTIPPQVLAKIATLPTRERGSRIYGEASAPAGRFGYGSPVNRLAHGLSLIFRPGENRAWGALD